MSDQGGPAAKGTRGCPHPLKLSKAEKRLCVHFAHFVCYVQ